MPLTPQTLPKHELTGLAVRVADSTDPGKTALEGTVVEETAKTLVIDVTGADRTVTVPKAESTFTFDLGESVEVRIDGERLVADPARRTETRGESPWQ